MPGRTDEYMDQSSTARASLRNVRRRQLTSHNFQHSKLNAPRMGFSVRAIIMRPMT